MIQRVIPAPLGQRFRLSCVDWASYRTIADALGERHVRLTYDRGNLEFMTVSHRHEGYGNLLGRLIETLAEELDIPMQSSGSTTLNREDLEQGVEPDESYYLEHEALVRGKDEIDLNVDPPPDLVVEIDISRSSLDRMSIYASLKVPEVWRFDGKVLQVYQLTSKGAYRAAKRSRSFPMVPMGEVQAFLLRRGQVNETQLVKSFRQWVREQIAHNWKKP